MQSLCVNARKEAGMTQIELAKKLHVSLRTYQDFESGQRQLNPAQALQLSRILHAPGLTMAFCRQSCAIGQEYGYNVLNNVDLSPMAVMTKFVDEAEEALAAVGKLKRLILNKKSFQDCSPAELAEIEASIGEIHDVIHNGKLALLALSKFVTDAQSSCRHHDKCLARGYHDTTKPALIKAG